MISGRGRRLASRGNRIARLTDTQDAYGQLARDGAQIIPTSPADRLLTFPGRVSAGRALARPDGRERAVPLTGWAGLPIRGRAFR